MSRIERIELMAVDPDIPHTTWASMPPQHLNLTIARVWDSDGAVGTGATQTAAPAMSDTSTFHAAAALAVRLLGKDADDREARWDDLQTLVLPAPGGSVAVLDNALWDLAAQRAGLPLFRYLGASREWIEAYASTAELGSVADYLELIARLAEQGFHAVKFHAWNEPERDLEMLRAVAREYEGSSITFMHDAENRYDRVSAIRVAQVLDELGFRWLEAPLIDYDLDGYLEIRKHADIALVPHGLWITDLRELAVYLRHRPWDAVRFDACKGGGISGARRMCSLAEAFGLPVELQSWGYSLIQAPNLHLELSLARSSFFELPIPYEAYEYAVENPIRLRPDGTVVAPELPGIGLGVDWDRIATDRLEYRDLRADGPRA